MGDIDSVTGVHLVQLEIRQKKKKNGKFKFVFVSIAIWQNNNFLIFLEHLTNSRVNLKM